MSIRIRTVQDDEAEALVVSGKTALAEDAFEDAMRLFSEALRIVPDHALANSFYGLSLALFKGKPEAGLEYCQTAIKTRHPDPVLYHNAALIFIELGKRREAISAIKAGLKIDGGNRDIHATWKKIGKRKRPVLGFLDRDHWLNQFLGKASHRRAKNKNAKTKS